MKYEKHGYATKGIHPIYRRWYQMKERCHNPKNPDYKYYGARGITVCIRWRNSLQHFVEDMGVPKKGMTLERVNNNKGYSKSNCKWATRAEQSKNTRSAVLILFKGKMRTAGEISKITGERSHTIWQRNHRRRLSAL